MADTTTSQAGERTQEKIKGAKNLTYDPTQDALFADGEYVGGASEMTRDMMLEMVDESWYGDDDEALFDGLVETV